MGYFVEQCLTGICLDVFLMARQGLCVLGRETTDTIFITWYLGYILST